MAALLLVSVIARGGRGGRYIALACLLIALAILLWSTAIRTPLAIP